MAINWEKDGPNCEARFGSFALVLKKLKVGYEMFASFHFVDGAGEFITYTLIEDEVTSWLTPAEAQQHILHLTRKRLAKFIAELQEEKNLLDRSEAN